MTDPFADIKARKDDLVAQIRAEYVQAELDAQDLIKRGRYSQERYLRQQTREIVNRMERELYHCLVNMPPFCQYRDGVYYMYPVTEENRHILVDEISAAHR